VTAAQSLLWPFSLAYGAAARLRAVAYRRGILRQRRLPGIVISVGNLTTGGTGKTPMVLWIAHRLAAQGAKCAILTRGYRGSARGGANGATAERESDEVRLLRARLGDAVAIGVGASRYARGAGLAARGVNYFVLDDGFQHLALARDANILLLDATNPFGGGHLLPAGRMREPLAALARSGIVVITRTEQAAPSIEMVVRRYTDAPIFYACARLDSVRSFSGRGYPGDEDAGAGTRKYLAFCGIGNPNAFFADAQLWGLHLAATLHFPDHHRYTQRDAARIEAAARDAGADALLCTEKDIFNLGEVRWREFDLSYCRISLRPEREEELWRAILAQAAAAGRTPGALA